MKPLARDARGRRVGAFDFPKGVWLLAAACGSWLILLVAAEALKWAALAAAGLI